MGPTMPRHPLARSPLASTLLLTALALAPVCAPLQAQESAPAAAAPSGLPAVAELLAKHAKAMGGAESIEGVKSMRFKGSLDSGLSVMEIDVATMVPGMTRIVYAAQSRRWETACDGTIAWSTDPTGGKPMLLEKEIVEGMKSGVDFQGLFRAPGALFEILSTTGSETIGGVDCWTVSMRSKTGEPVTGFFAKESGLFTALRQTQKTPRGEATMSMQATEWQEVQYKSGPDASPRSIRVAKSIDVVESGRRSSGTFTGFEVNTLDAGYFAPPAAVKELADAAARTAQPAQPATR